MFMIWKKTCQINVFVCSTFIVCTSIFFNFYHIITWFGKPPVLSPIQCAKYGWVNIESDMLQCKICRAVICATLPVNFDPKVCKFMIFVIQCNDIDHFECDAQVCQQQNMVLLKKLTFLQALHNEKNMISINCRPYICKEINRKTQDWPWTSL